MGELIYIGSCAGRFWALDIKTGKERWSYDITQDGDQLSFHGNPLVTDSLIITGTDGRGIGHLYAFDRETGNVRWMYPDERGFTTDLVRHGQSLYAVSASDELICVDINGGELLWYHSDTSAGPRPFSSSPAIAGDRVFFGTRKGTLYSLSAVSGRVLWRQDVGARVATAVVSGEVDVFLGTAGGYVYRLAPEDGELLDTLFIGETEERSATIGNPVLFDSVLIVLRDGGKELMGVDRSLSHIEWRIESETTWSSFRPHPWRDVIVVGDGAGKLHAVDPTTGRVRWTEEFEGTLRGIGSAGDVIFIGTLEGMVYAWQVRAEHEETE